MPSIFTHCKFSGVLPDGNCAYVHWGSFTSNSRSVRRAIWFTWFSEPHECIQHLAVPGGHPSNYEPDATLLNFSDRANTDELTPYSVYKCTYAHDMNVHKLNWRSVKIFPANRMCWTNVGLILADCPRRWTNIKPIGLLWLQELTMSTSLIELTLDTNIVIPTSTGGPENTQKWRRYKGGNRDQN